MSCPRAAGRAPLDGRRRFAARPDRELDLAEGALWIARLDGPPAEPEPWLRRLDELGRLAGGRLRGRLGAFERSKAPALRRTSR